jgi:hypothetical protein
MEAVITWAIAATPIAKQRPSKFFQVLENKIKNKQKRRKEKKISCMKPEN